MPEDIPAFPEGTPPLDAAGRYEVLVLAKGIMSAHGLATGVYVIGRGEDVDLGVADGLVSRRHAFLTVRHGVSIRDIGSRNGTLVRGARLAAGVETELRPGDAIVIGAALLLVQRAQFETSASLQAPVHLSPAIPAESEKERLLDALEASGGNQKRAAITLGISRRTLAKRMNQHGIPRPRRGVE